MQDVPTLHTHLALPLVVLLAACGSEDDSSTKPDDTGSEPETCEKQEYWLDGDDDGWGGSYVPIEACEQPSGYAAEPGDCDDADPAVHPGVAEICDGIDNDCDLLVDEGFDADEDGFAVCGEMPDCNDTDEAVHPEADEVCNARDDNCDGVADEGLECDYLTAGEIEGLGDHGAMGGGCNCDATPSASPAPWLAALFSVGLLAFRRR